MLLHLDDRLLSVARNLPLLARQLVAGYMQGLHRSPFRGSSQEFAAYRAYIPGDSIRDVDWKVWARSDNLFVREFEEETNYRGYLFLDTSRSMDFGEGAENKFFYARVLCATLALLMRNQNDAPGLTLLGQPSDDVRAVLPPGTRNDHLDQLLQRLQDAEADSRSDELGPVAAHLDACASRSVSVLVTDALFPLDQARAFLDQLRMRDHQTIFFHVLARQELEPDFEDDMTMIDSETGRELAVDGLAMREPYQKRLAEFLAEVQELCVQTETEYLLAATDQPLDELLHAFLTLRSSRGR